MFHDKPRHADALENWEQWPLAALFLTNALNVFLLYVPLADMPPSVRDWLPWVRVACGIAAAASLEGTLIAVTMGRRLGRNSIWSWATMLSASVFTAAVAYYVHYEVGIGAAILFMAQAIVLFIYSQHLAQPRKALHPPNRSHGDVQEHENGHFLASDRAVTVSRLDREGYTCHRCGAKGFQTLADIQKHRRTDPNCIAEPSASMRLDSTAIQSNGHKV